MQKPSSSSLSLDKNCVSVQNLLCVKSPSYTRPSCYKFTTDWLLVTKQSLLLDPIIDQSYLRFVSVVYHKFHIGVLERDTMETFLA